MLFDEFISVFDFELVGEVFKGIDFDVVM